MGGRRLQRVGDVHLAFATAFELAVGANGRVWISSSSAAMVVLSQAAILRSQGVADEDHGKLVDELAERFEISPEHEQAT